MLRQSCSLWDSRGMQGEAAAPDASDSSTGSGQAEPIIDIHQHVGYDRGAGIVRPERCSPVAVNVTPVFT
jgi:hypothetical protein